MIGWLCVQLGDSSKTVSTDTYVYRFPPRWRRVGIVHIRTDSNSWCLCLNHQPSGSLSPCLEPSSARLAANKRVGNFGVSTPLDHFSLFLSLSVCLSICISLSRSLAINVRRFHIPSRTSFVAETDLADSIEDSKERFVGSFMISWIPDGGRRGCAKLMRLKRGVYLK